MLGCRWNISVNSIQFVLREVWKNGKYWFFHLEVLGNIKRQIFSKTEQLSFLGITFTPYLWEDYLSSRRFKHFSNFAVLENFDSTSLNNRININQQHLRTWLTRGCLHFPSCCLLVFGEQRRHTNVGKRGQLENS